MNGNGGYAAIGMLYENVASASASDRESGALERANYVLALQARQARHTVIC